MAAQPNKTMIGVFVVISLVLLVAGVLAFGGGAFFQDTFEVVFRFEGDVKGLDLGAPVAIKGFKIGAVTDMTMDYNLDEERFYTTVRAEMYPVVNPAGSPETVRRFAEARAQGVDEVRDELFRQMVADGMRAQLNVRSIVTGMLQVELDFDDDAEPAEVTRTADGAWEIPTIATTMEKLRQSLADIPISDLLKDVQETLDGINHLVNSEETRGALKDFSSTLKEVDSIVTRLSGEYDEIDRNVGGLVEAATSLVKTSEEKVNTIGDRLGKSLEDVDQLVKDVSEQVDPLATRLEGTLDDSRKLVNNLNERVEPIAERVEKLADTARGTLEEARQMVASLQGLAPRDAAIAHQLSATLDSLSGAMDSLNRLASYLERHPEALLKGKD